MRQTNNGSLNLSLHNRPHLAASEEKLASDIHQANVGLVGS